MAEGFLDGLMPNRPLAKVSRMALMRLKTGVEKAQANLANRQSEQGNFPQEQGQTPQPLAGIKEKFGNFKGFGFGLLNQQPVKEPTPEELALEEEAKKQLFEQAEARKKQEEADAKVKADADALRRARNNLSVCVGGQD